MIARYGVALLTSLLLAAATAMVPTVSDERTMYGLDGPIEQNWRPRELAGWPAPYLADNPDTSVAHKIGPEDDFRPGPFIATASFWMLVSLLAMKLIGKVRSLQRRLTAR